MSSPLPPLTPSPPQVAKQHLPESAPNHCHVLTLISTHVPPALVADKPPSEQHVKRNLSSEQIELLQQATRSTSGGLVFTFDPNLIDEQVNIFEASLKSADLDAERVERWKTIIAEHTRYHARSPTANEVYHLHPIFDHQLFGLVHLLVADWQDLFTPESGLSDVPKAQIVFYQRVNHSGKGSGHPDAGARTSRRLPSNMSDIMEIKLPKQVAAGETVDFAEGTTMLAAASDSGLKLSAQEVRQPDGTLEVLLKASRDIADMNFHLLQLVDEMSRSMVVDGVWTCYEFYFLVRQIRPFHYAISKLIPRDTNWARDDPLYIANTSPLLFLVSNVVRYMRNSQTQNEHLARKRSANTSDQDEKRRKFTKGPDQTGGGPSGSGRTAGQSGNTSSSSSHSGSSNVQNALNLASVPGSDSKGLKTVDRAADQRSEEDSDFSDPVSSSGPQTPEPIVIDDQDPSPEIKGKLLHTDTTIALRLAPSILAQRAYWVGSFEGRRLGPIEPFLPHAQYLSYEPPIDITLREYVDYGRNGQICEASIGTDGQPVIVKILDTEFFEADPNAPRTHLDAKSVFVNELKAYERLVDLQGKVLPKLLGAFQAHGSSSSIYFLVMEHVGPAWDSEKASDEEWESVLDIVEQIHARGVTHGDLDIRHFRHSSKGLRIIDFDRAEVLEVGSQRWERECQSEWKRSSYYLTPRRRTGHRQA